MKAIGHSHNQKPRVITVDKNAAYPPAIDDLKAENILNKNSRSQIDKKITNLCLGLSHLILQEEFLKALRQ
jgi:spore coat polysaccharide biosynthesis predicted glycosyltransferase SpsG